MLRRWWKTVDYGGRGLWWTWIMVDVDYGGRGLWWTWIMVDVDYGGRGHVSPRDSRIA
jgi:hypothetical protein